MSTISPDSKPVTTPGRADVSVKTKADTTTSTQRTAVSIEVPVDESELRLPPVEENPWEKYASNGEPIISGMASVLLHGLALLLVVVGLGWLFSSSEPPLEELEPVLIGNGEEGGGGGHREGVEVGNPGNLTRPPDEVTTLDEEKPKLEKVADDEPKVQQSKAPTIPEVTLNEDLSEKLKRKPAASNLGPVLKDALEGLAGKGLGGSGRGGGEGTGVGRGRGSGVGDGTGRTNRRGRRNLRWELSFGVSDARQYLQQTDACGMILAIPDKDGRLMTIRDIRQRPAVPQYEDIKALNRNWFIDDRKESAESVAAELGLNVVPSVLVFFYPIEFENKLLEKELAFRNKKEEEITYTKFAISFSGGKPVIRVVEQR